MIPPRLAAVATGLAPSAASASQRASQLAVLWTLSASASGLEQSHLIAGFGLIATFVMISDSGAGNYLLSRREEELRRSTFRRACEIHVAISLVGVAACFAFLVAVLRGPVSTSTWIVLGALALTQLFDNISRVVRYPLLNTAHEWQFAWPETVCSVAKTGLCIWAGLTAHLAVVVLLPAISSVVLVLALGQVRATLSPEWSDPPASRAILTFGLTGAMNASYSQLPLIFTSVLLANSSTAVLATCARMFQALEIVPGTLALQAIPRYARGRLTVGRDWLLMSALAGCLGLALVPFLPAIGRLLSLELSPRLCLLLAGAFVARCGGYVLSSYFMGSGRITARLRLMLAAMAIMIVLTPFLVWRLGLYGGALTSVVAESLLAALLAQHLVRRQGDRRGHGLATPRVGAPV